jgi:hypothetical protein
MDMSISKIISAMDNWEETAAFRLLLRMQSLHVLLDAGNTFVSALWLTKEIDSEKKRYTIYSVQHPWFIPTFYPFQIATIVHRTPHLPISLCEKNVFIPLDLRFLWLNSNSQLSFFWFSLRQRWNRSAGYRFHLWFQERQKRRHKNVNYMIRVFQSKESTYSYCSWMILEA